MRRTALRTLALAALLTALLTGAATAFWTGAGTGSGTAPVGSLSVPVVTVPNNANGTVPVSWTAATVLPSVPALNALVTYAVERSVDNGATWQTASGTCAGSIAAPTVTCDDAPSADGNYNYRVTATMRTWTARSATSTTRVNFNGALVAPTITAKPAARSANTAPSFSFTGGGSSSGSGGLTYECQIDGGGWVACTSPRALSGLTNGSHTFMVRSARGANRGPVASYTWIVDTSAPTFSSTPPNPSASTSATFAFAHANYTTLQCRLDAAAFAACTSPRALTGLAAGSHTFQVRALDADGIATTAGSSTWTVATAAPTITGQPANPTANATSTFAFNAPGFPAYACRIDGGAFAACNAGTVAYTGLATGSHTFTVHAVDAAGNATADATVTWTVQAPPTIGFFGGCPWTGTGTTRFVGTTTRATGTVTVNFYAGPTATGAPVATITSSTFTFLGLGLWTVITNSGQLTAGAQYTGTAQQTDGTGGLSNTLTCTFNAT